MKSSNKNSLILLGLLILATATALAALPVTNQRTSTVAGQRKGDEDAMPIADFSTPEPMDPQERALRQARGARHNNRAPQPIAELAPGEEVLPLNNHWWWGLPALPARISDAVVVGEIKNAKAFLSGDKTSVYSEFTLRIDVVLKNDPGFVSSVGNEIVAERPGGIVRFPSGRLQRYSTAHQGMPKVGRKYVLFLRFNGSSQDFSILTAYELRDAGVMPLDGNSSDGEQAIPSFSAFAGMDESVFLKTVSDAISDTSPDYNGKRNQ